MGIDPRDRLRAVRRWLFYRLVRLLAFGIQKQPRVLAVWPLRVLAKLAFRIRPLDRARAEAQLALAFPNLEGSKRTRLYRDSLLALADNLVDALRDEGELLMNAVDAQRLQELSRGDRPLLLLMGHLGNWELVGRRLAHHLPPFAALSANPHNLRVDYWLREERARHGVRCFDRRRELGGAARWLKRGGTLALLADYRVGRDGAWLPIFGRPAPCARGPARLAHWAQALVLPVASRREGDAHRLILGDLLDPRALEEEELLGRMHAALESLIREVPEEWTWFHDRYGNEIPPGPSADPADRDGLR